MIGREQRITKRCTGVAAGGCSVFRASTGRNPVNAVVTTFFGRRMPKQPSQKTKTAVLFICTLSLACTMHVVCNIKALAGWQYDYSVFLATIDNVTQHGRIPSRKEMLEKCDSDGAFPITDGAGGFVDLTPGRNTVQYYANASFAERSVKWKVHVQYAIRKTTEEQIINQYTNFRTGPMFMITPKPPEPGNSFGSRIPGDINIIWLDVQQSSTSFVDDLQADRDYLIEGQIRNASHLAIMTFFGVHAVYHLDGELSDGNKRNLFYIVGISDARITPL